MKRKHPIPEGYRQLKASEVVKQGDSMIKKSNTSSDILVECCGGYPVGLNKNIAYYRKLKSSKETK